MDNIHQPRRKFLQTGATGVASVFFGIFPKIGFSQSASGNDKGLIVREAEGIHILTRRKVPITIKISKTKHGIEGISFCTEDMTPGRKMRIHKHLDNDELIFIHKGEGTLTLDEQLVEVKTGDVALCQGHMAWTGQYRLKNLLTLDIRQPVLRIFYRERHTCGIPKERTEEEYYN
jgi:mannose-6-phosphate isomerase-like protein (cupin superfamily)